MNLLNHLAVAPFPVVPSQLKMLLHLLFTRSAYNTTRNENTYLKVTYPEEKEKTRKNINHTFLSVTMQKVISYTMIPTDTVSPVVEGDT